MRVVAEYPCAATAFGNGLQPVPAVELRGPRGERVLAYVFEIEFAP